MGLTAVRKQSLAPRELVRETAEGFAENRLLTYASAIAFQTTLALPAFLLFAAGLTGFLELDELWTRDVAPELERSVSQPAFALIDDTVRKVLTEKQLFWVTVGAAVALWEVSGAVRAVMGAIDEIHSGRPSRSLRQTLGRSLLLALAVSVLVLGAAAAVRFGPFLLGWVVATALVALTVGLLVHLAGEKDQPLPWASFGTGLVVVGWIVMSLGFGFYVTRIADYASVYGHLATFFLSLVYIYAAATVFLGGLQVDAVVRRRVA